MLFTILRNFYHVMLSPVSWVIACGHYATTAGPQAEAHVWVIVMRTGGSTSMECGKRRLLLVGYGSVLCSTWQENIS